MGREQPHDLLRYRGLTLTGLGDERRPLLVGLFQSRFEDFADTTPAFRARCCHRGEVRILAEPLYSVQARCRRTPAIRTSHNFSPPGAAATKAPRNRRS